MRNFICIFCCILTLSSIACKNTRQKELSLKKKEQALQKQERELKEREARLKESSAGKDETENDEPEERSAPETATKYVYVLITTNEPELHSIKEEAPLKTGPTGYFDDSEGPKYRVYATPVHYNYASEIVTISDYNEDKKYMLMDRYENQVNQRLRDVNSNLKTQERLMMAETPSHAEATIISRKSFVFESYREASEHRSKHE